MPCKGCSSSHRPSAEGGVSSPPEHPETSSIPSGTGGCPLQGAPSSRAARMGCRRLESTGKTRDSTRDEDVDSPSPLQSWFSAPWDAGDPQRCGAQAQPKGFPCSPPARRHFLGPAQPRGSGAALCQAAAAQCFPNAALRGQADPIPPRIQFFHTVSVRLHRTFPPSQLHRWSS